MKMDVSKHNVEKLSLCFTLLQCLCNYIPFFFFIYAFVDPVKVKFMFLHNDTYTLYFPDQKLFVFFTSREYKKKTISPPPLDNLDSNGKDCINEC